MSESLKRTPLHRCHLQLGARIVPFAGYEMPVQYTGVLDETKATRAAAGLFDVSHMGQFSVRGKDALLAVETLVSNQVRKLSLGQAQYNMLCNDSGGVIDDLIVYHRAPDHTYICVNASNRAVDFKWMKERLPRAVELVDESDETALIALQGPKSVEILSKIADAPTLSAVKYYWAVETKVMGLPCYLSRTGYTGEDGFELYVKASDGISLWEKLLEIGRASGLVPCGLGARDTLRTEMGYPLHGHELSQEISPLSAGLQWVVKLEREVPFPGQKALKEEAARGPAKVLKGFTVEDRRIPRAGYRLVDENKRAIGSVTSGTQSPHLGSPIALGFVENSQKDKTSFFVEVREALVPARVTSLPFLKPNVRK